MSERRFIFPNDSYLKISELELLLYRMQNECDVHANALATRALGLLNEARDGVIVENGEDG